MSEVVSLAIINVGVLWFLSILAVNTDDENHAALKLFFILGTIWMAVNTLSLGINIAEAATLDSSIINSLNTNFWILIVSAVITSFYFVVYYIKEVFETINKLVFRKRNRQNG